MNNSGVIRARTVKKQGGVIRLSGDAAITNTGTLDVTANRGSGGEVALDGRFVALGGNVDASGQQNGGKINIVAQGDISLAGQVAATGKAGNGGSVNYQAGEEIVASSTSVTDVSGVNGGSIPCC